MTRTIESTSATPEGLDVDYDQLWTQKWGDLQQYGPTSRHQRRIIADLLDPQHFDSILDVGCGEGSLLAFLGPRYRCHRMLGLDLSASAIERARQTFPSASYIVGDIGALPRGEQFDLVTCIDVLEHVEDDESLLRDIAAAS